MNNLIPKRSDLFFPMEDYFNSIFDNFFNDDSFNSMKSRSNYPKMDIYTDDKWNVEVSIPGVKTEDINVEVIPGRIKMLKVSGKMGEEKKSVDYKIKELRRSSFERIVSLPDNVEGEPEATLKDGILKLSWEITKTKEPETKKISIKNLN